MQTTVHDIAKPVIWVIGRHPLVADYLMHVLRNDSHVQPQWIGEPQLQKGQLGNNPLLLLDAGGLDFSAADYLRTLKAKVGETRCIILDKRLDVYVACQLLCLGAQGFLTYEQVSDYLSLAIQSVCNGQMWVDARVLQRYMRMQKRERHSLATTPAGNTLTIREEEILHLARQRYSNKEIASLLDIEVSTVKFHLSNIFSKLQVAGRSDLWRNASHGEAVPFHDSATASELVHSSTMAED